MYVLFSQHPAMVIDCCDVGQTQLTFDRLPDDAFLYVFDFYVAQSSEVEAWHTLVHVSRRWRNLVFGSPRRLHLKIKCTNETRVKEKLDVWPAMPIIISGECRSLTCMDNIKAALAHHDRVCQIKLHFISREPGDIVASLEEPFPILTDLDLSAADSIRPFEPDPSKFLGGPTRLQSLILSNIRIRDLAKLLLSTPNLVILRLDKIRNWDNNNHNDDFFLLDEMVTGLSALTRLEQLDLLVKLHPSLPDWENRRFPLLTRIVVPSLTVLKFRGATQTLEDFMALIDAPLLDHLYLLFILPISDQVIVLDTPHILRFISRISNFQAPDKAHIAILIKDRRCQIELWRPGQISSMVKLEISSRWSRQLLPFLAQFCRPPFFPLPTLECLYIDGGQDSMEHRRDDAEYAQWLELLRPFASVKNLYVTKELAIHIARALQELVGERVMEVLPTLESVFIDNFQPSGPAPEVIKELVTARRLAGHPIFIYPWT
jgi:hypothetical protein